MVWRPDWWAKEEDKELTEEQKTWEKDGNREKWMKILGVTVLQDGILNHQVATFIIFTEAMYGKQFIWQWILTTVRNRIH